MEAMMKRLYGGMEGGGTNGNWNGNWDDFRNTEVDALLIEIPTETDPARIKADYTLLTKICLTDVPSLTLMYRPQEFQIENEKVWTG
jgi:peptide/nickel transport system substrate-binding protein